MTIQNFSMVAGNSKSIIVDIGSLSGIFEFNIKQNNVTLVQKTNLQLTGTILTITLNSADTKGFAGDYEYECILTDEYGNVSTVVSGTISFSKGSGITAEQVFLTAMDLMDEESEDGTYNGYPEEYKKKAWRILTLLQSELTPASMVPSSVTDETSTFYLDDRTSLTVLPYGLAAHLLMNEDQNRASFFNSRYDELKRKRPARAVKISDVYNSGVMV
jgi:hypothetical protein